MKKGTVILLTVGGTAAVVTTIILVGKARNKKLLAQVNAAIDGGSADAGTVADVVNQPVLDPAYWKKLGATESTTGITTFLNNPLSAVANGAAPIIMSKDTAIAVADNINSDHHTLLPNNQDDMIAQISHLGTKAKISYVSYQFQQKYGQSLGQFFANQLDDTHKENLAAYLNSVKA